MREEEMFIALAGMTVGFFTVRVLARSVTQMFCHWRDVALKIRLVDAGLDADQIEHVVLAGRYEQPKKQRAHAAIEKQHRPKPMYASH